MASSNVSTQTKERLSDQMDAASDVPSSGISRPLSEILRELNRKVPDSFIKTRVEDGFSIKYVPWYVSLLASLHLGLLFFFFLFFFKSVNCVV